jgi:predicted RNA methylase
MQAKNPFNDSLKEISNTLFNEDANYGEVFTAVRAYKKLLMDAARFEIGNIPQDETIVTASGKAIGPTYASSCIDDVFRTYKFICGIFKAVEELRKNGVKKVHIAYAGTGPFAALVLPLTTVFSEDEITFTLIEINPKSLELLKQTLNAFNLNGYVKKIHLEDATLLQLPDGDTIDMLVVEAMTNALKSEHQVAICYNIVPQLRDDSILIPQEINLNLLAIDAEKLKQHKLSLDSEICYYEKLGKLFTLNKATIQEHAEEVKSNFPTHQFPIQETVLPEYLNEEFTELSIETFIQVYGPVNLSIDESGLTVLCKLYEINPMKELGTVLQSKYICGKLPRLQCKIS